MDPLESPAAPAAPSPLWRWAGPLVFTVVLAGALPSLPYGVVNWDNEVKLQVARNLAQGRGPVLTEPTPDDAAYVVRGRDGRRFSPYPLLSSALQLVTLAAIPALGPREGAGTLLVLALLGWALVAWGRAAGVSLEAAVAGALLVTLGTVLWPMAALGYDVLVEALALALFLRAGTGEAADGRWALAGLAFGAALATRLGASVLVLSAAVLLLAQRPGGLGPTVRRSVIFGLATLPGVALVLWFNQLRFGSPLEFMRPSALGQLDQLASPWFSRAHLEGMAGLLVSPGKGLFWYAVPLLGVVAVAPLLVRRHGATIAALGAQLVASMFVFGSFRYWHGDWAWGPRYVAPLCVAAAPLAWCIVERVHARPRGPRLAAGAALLLAILAASRSGRWPACGRALHPDAPAARGESSAGDLADHPPPGARGQPAPLLRARDIAVRLARAQLLARPRRPRKGSPAGLGPDQCSRRPAAGDAVDGRHSLADPGTLALDGGL